MKKYNISIEAVYAISMIILFSLVYITILILVFTFLYDGYLEWFANKQGTEFGFYTGIIGMILLVGVFWALFPKKRDGIILNKKDATKLFELVDNVVTKTKIHPINTIKLVPGSSIAVTGFFNKQLLIGVASTPIGNFNELVGIYNEDSIFFDTCDGAFSTVIETKRGYLDSEEKINEEEFKILKPKAEAEGYVFE